MAELGFVVIPGRRSAASPEPINTAAETARHRLRIRSLVCVYGFRAPSLRSGPGMTVKDGSSTSSPGGDGRLYSPLYSRCIGLTSAARLNMDELTGTRRSSRLG